jgi:hypothetical protein
LIGTDPLPTSDTRASILAALKRAGWQLDSDEPHVIEASDEQQSYGVTVFFERGAPVEICYGDGENLQFCEEWHEAPGILAPEEVARLFGDEEGEQE